MTFLVRWASRVCEALLRSGVPRNGFVPSGPSRCLWKGTKEDASLEGVRNLDGHPIEVLGKIGSGSHAEVFRGRTSFDEGVPVEVAVKVMRRCGLTKLAQEARALSLLEGVEGVPLLYGVVVVAEGPPSLVMEHRRGKTLRECMASERPPLVMRGMADACDVMQEIHDRGVVHMDVHTSNILLDVGGGGVRASVVDFGSALVRGQLSHARMDTYEEMERTRLASVAMGFMPFMYSNAQETHEFVKVVTRSFTSQEPPTPKELAQSLRNAIPRGY